MVAKNPLPVEKISSALKAWFDPKKRGLPWRKTKDPYKIWISEIMLQQTTSQAVKGYFDKFISKWPTVKDLAQAEIEDVYEYWQGLGYYSRARNILKAAQIVVSEHEGHLPQKASELIKLPGIGPYTSRAISSLCFEEKVGVVDGNVLRLHNRLLGKKLNWWEKDFFNLTQEFSDKACNQKIKASIINPALMDIGSTICSPKKPSCLICPLTKFCQSYKKGVQEKIPLPKPKLKKEDWLYTVYKNPHTGSWLNVNLNPTDSPVLKSRPLPFGSFKKLDQKPKSYDFMHTITKHKIYIQFKKAPKNLRLKPEKMRLSQLNRLTPSSLIKKIWQADGFHENI